jgi:hypothetical protein
MIVGDMMLDLASDSLLVVRAANHLCAGTQVCATSCPVCYGFMLCIVIFATLMLTLRLAADGLLVVSGAYWCPAAILSTYELIAQ